MSAARRIRNPILPGFNPDPSICRVGDDYFIATSTFEWYPGVQIHHSRDLVHWRLIGRPLERAAQLDLRGNPDSCGVWAPCLSFSDGRFWLVYTDVKRFDGDFKDAHNHVVTATDPAGRWSDPTYLNSSGFDPSLFHDEDGSRWLLNLVWNHRANTLGPSPRHSPFGGIALQRFDADAGALTGERRVIFTGSERGLAEGAHLLRHDGWYHLIVAEGGTGYEHAVTHARSRDIGGPYELHPDAHVITADPTDGGALQRAGHGQPIMTADGEWYHVHLCSRPLDVRDPARRRSPLGRETAIQRVRWDEDGWMRLADGGRAPSVSVEAPARGDDAAWSRPAGEPGAAHAGAPVAPVDDGERRYRFDTPWLPLDFQWLRTPDWQRLFSLTARPGRLRLYGRESLGSWFEQALVARRQQHRDYAAELSMEVAPETFQQGAGLVAYYDRHRFHALFVTHDEARGRVLTIASCPGDWPAARLDWPLGDGGEATLDDGSVDLGCDVQDGTLRFRWRQGTAWSEIGPVLDASLLSDEAGRGEHASFTGAFVGAFAFDVSGRALVADVASFAYCPLPETASASDAPPSRRDD